MELTLKERLILSNQLKILEALYPEEAEYYARHRKAIEYGFRLHYSWVAEHIDQNELSEENCRFVLDVLGMFRALNHAQKQLTDSSGITAENVCFPGFDGNNEADLYSYALYFVIDLDRFEELRGGKEHPDFNSHMPKSTRYQAMLNVYNAIPHEQQLNLSAEQVRSILDA